MRLLLMLIVCVTSGCTYKTYSGYQVLRTSPLDETTFAKVAAIAEDSRFDFWEQPALTHRSLILVSPDDVTELYKLLQGVKTEVYISDVGRLVEKDRVNMESLTRQGTLHGNVTFSRYMSLEEIEAYLENVATSHPDLVTMETIAETLEGRPVRMLKISSGPGKNVVLMDAAIHAREWVAPPVVFKIISELVEKRDAEMLELTDWYIIPMANPDGYEYSWNEDRFWRKNRKPSDASDCIGVDLNRNFDIHWGHYKADEPCHVHFPGTSPHSEVETRSIANIIKALGQEGRLKLYMAVHSYSTIILHPYGHSATELPSAEMIAAAHEARKTIFAVRGTNYTIGSPAQLLYAAYGSSQDYAYDVGGVPYSYTWELPGGGTKGFDLEPSQILPVVEETWEGMKTLARIAMNGTSKQTTTSELL